MTQTSNGSDLWIIWTDQHGNSCASIPHVAHVAQTPEEIEATRVRLEADRQERERQAKERVEQQKAAQAKAMQLLRENLSQKQREQLDKRNWFLVEGGKSKKTYRIHGDRHAGNIYEVEGGQDVARYCVHASYEIPLGDQLLAQAISLRLDEEHIIRAANKTQLRAA